MKDERVLIVRVKLNIDDEALRSLTDRLKKSFEDALKGTEFGKVAERFAKAVSGAGLDVSGFQKASKELARVGEELKRAGEQVSEGAKSMAESMGRAVSGGRGRGSRRATGEEPEEEDGFYITLGYGVRGREKIDITKMEPEEIVNLIMRTRPSMERTETAIVRMISRQNEIFGALASMGGALARWGFFRVFFELARGLATPYLAIAEHEPILEQAFKDAAKIKDVKKREEVLAKLSNVMEQVSGRREASLVLFNLAKLVLIAVGAYALLRVLTGEMFNVSGYLSAVLSLFRASMVLIFKPILDLLGATLLPLALAFLPFASFVSNLLNRVLTAVLSIQNPVLRMAAGITSLVAILAGIYGVVRLITKAMGFALGKLFEFLVRRRIGLSPGSIANAVKRALRDYFGDDFFARFRGVFNLKELPERIGRAVRNALRGAGRSVAGEGAELGIRGGLASIARAIQGLLSGPGLRRGIRPPATLSLRGLLGGATRLAKGFIQGLLLDIALRGGGWLLAGEEGARYGGYLSTILGTAILGAGIGSVAPGIGTLAGAVAGGIAGAIIGLFTDLGYSMDDVKDALNKLKDKIMEQVDKVTSFNLSIESVYRILEIVRPSLALLLPDLDTLSEGFDALSSMLDSVGDAFGELKKSISEFIDGLKNTLSNIWSTFKEKIGLSGAPPGVSKGSEWWWTPGSFQVGGPVPETGLYMLHRGEYVVPRNPGLMVGNITVNVYPPAGASPEEIADEVIRRIGELFRVYGVQI